jgi:hypothetical protein
MTRHVTFRVCTAAALSAMLSWPFAAAPAASAEGGKELLQANVFNMEAGAGPNTGRLIVNIDHYTTDEELQPDIEAFKAGGQKALVDRWWKDKPVVGSARFAQTLGLDLRVARSRPTGFEVSRSLRSEDYPIAWIEVDVDANGKGEGRMVPAAQLTVKDGSLVVESFGTQPLKLVTVQIKPR